MEVIILNCLVEEPCHFAQLRRYMPNISQKVLTEQLGGLIAGYPLTTMLVAATIFSFWK